MSQVAKTHRNVMPNMPKVVCDIKQQHYFTVGEFLGKGGFGACYKLTDKSGVMYAAKVVGKHLLKTKSHTEKLAQEVTVHLDMKHENIVKLYFAFEDQANVYMLLELCARKSMMELLKRRKHVTEPEARYFIQHLCSACVYMHGQKVVHRDLKLGNLFLTDDMVLKVGDFGLATVLGDGMKDKNWLCGTPNYIAPEVLAKKSHTEKVDIWAVGCVLYALLVGNPPFETNSLDSTYKKISNNDYSIPSSLSVDAGNLLRELLAANPTDRPDAASIMDFNFMKQFIPKSLPVSCLTTKPVFTQDNKACGDRRVVTNANGEVCSPMEYLQEIKRQINEVCDKQLPERLLSDDEIKEPADVPVYWVSKWVDYSEKYGLAYVLCDSSCGVAFTDRSKMLMDCNKKFCQYITKENTETFFDVEDCPKDFDRKLILLKQFEAYMSHNLMTMGADIAREGANIARLPVLECWVRTTTTINFLMSNGTYQCNFNSDHSKMVICPLMGAVTYVDTAQTFHTYKLKSIAETGAPPEVLKRLNYAGNYISKMLEIVRQKSKRKTP